MLPPFATDTPAVRNALMEPGKNGGIMDAADEMDIVTNPNLAPYLRLPLAESIEERQPGALGAI